MSQSARTVVWSTWLPPQSPIGGLRLSCQVHCTQEGAHWPTPAAERKKERIDEGVPTCLEPPLETFGPPAWVSVLGGWLGIRLPPLAVWLANGELSPDAVLRGVAQEGNARLEVAVPSSLFTT